MKFTSLFALVGAACAQGMPDATTPKDSTPERHVYVPSPCDNTENKFYNTRYQFYGMRESCDVSQRKASQPSKQNQWVGCDPAKFDALRKDLDELGPLHHQCQIKDDQRHWRENGVDMESPSSHDGDIHFSLNWQKIGDYNHQWGNWFEGEARSKEAQEVAMHLNSAAKKMVNSIAGGQADVVRNGGHLVNAFTQWAEPGASCDSDAYVQCLSNNTRPGMISHRDIEHAFMGHCAEHTGCAIMNGTRAQGESGSKYQHATKNALAQMAHEVQNDVMGEMRSQKANIMHIAKDFLAEARERYTAWGCEPKCTKRHTRDFDRLEGMKHCHCPASITVSGDTSIILG